MSGRRKTKQSPWQKARHALYVAGIENYTSEFARHTVQYGWFNAHLQASLIAARDGRRLWIDMDNEDIAPFNAHLCSLLVLLEVDHELYVKTITHILDHGSCTPYDALSFKVGQDRNLARVLLYYKDVSCTLTVEAVQFSLDARINSVDFGEAFECAICLNTCMTKPLHFYECIHGFCSR
jgi:hypothetical protein